MMMIEKLEECPYCGEVKAWLYDAQMCANCGHGEIKSSQARDFTKDRVDAWLRDLWAAQSIDLHLCDGTRRDDQRGLLRNIREDARVMRNRSDIASDLLVSLKEISAMFTARPDMVKAIHPLIGFGEKAIFDRAVARIEKAETAGIKSD